MSKDIIVQITVQEHNNEFYTYGMLLIPKTSCTVIKTVEHVQDSDQLIKDLQAKLNTYEIEDSVTMKHVQPEPKLNEQIKGYCIKRILSLRENADLNIWANKKNGNTIPYYKGGGGYLHYSSGSAFILPIKLNGFTELFTVKDFFEKVGYTPEPQCKSLGEIDGMKAYAIKDIWGNIRVSTIKLAESDCIEIFCKERSWTELQDLEGCECVPVEITEIKK